MTQGFNEYRTEGISNSSQEEADLKLNEVRNRAAHALNDYIGSGEDMFNAKGIDLQVEALKGVEVTALRAMMITAKTEFQECVDNHAVIEDAFNQGVNLFRIVQHQMTLLVLLRSGTEVFKEGEAINAIKGLACHNQIEIIDDEQSLCKLMRSIIQLSNAQRGGNLNG